MSEYTKGPLGAIGPIEPSGDCAIVTKDSFRLVGEAYHKLSSYHDGCEIYADAHANARLWAASPELLAACEGILHAFEQGDFKRARPRQAETDPDHPALVNLRAAIARAKGEELGAAIEQSHKASQGD